MAISTQIIIITVSVLFGNKPKMNEIEAKNGSWNFSFLFCWWWLKKMSGCKTEKNHQSLNDDHKFRSNFWQNKPTHWRLLRQTKNIWNKLENKQSQVYQIYSKKRKTKILQKNGLKWESHLFLG